MADYYFILAKDILGLHTNRRGFNWSFGMNVPFATEEEFAACKVRLRLTVGNDKCISENGDRPSNEVSGKYSHFYGLSDKDSILYQRPFMFGKKLQFKVEGLLTDEPAICVNEAYYRLIAHRFMNLHSIDYTLTDLACFLLLRKGYSPLHCSAFKKGDATILVFAPPNTGKTLTAIMACKEHGAEFVSEDMVITDGEMIYAVPWTSSFRYYSLVDKSPLARTRDVINRSVPLLELLTIGAPKSSDEYFDKNSMFDNAKPTHIVILERGPISVRPQTESEAYRKIRNLNRHAFNYQKAPAIVAYEFFNPLLEIDAASKTEQALLREVVAAAHQRLTVSANEATQYASLITGALEADVKRQLR